MMTPTKSTIELRLTLVGNDFNVELVTKTLGITPNFTRDKKEILKNGKEFGDTEWGVAFQKHPSWDIEEHFNEMLRLFKGKEEKLVEVAEKCNAEWNLVYVIEIENGDKPAIGFTKSMISFLYDIKAEVGFDYYIYSLYQEG